jgi:hypothetical protein
MDSNAWGLTLSDTVLQAHAVYIQMGLTGSSLVQPHLPFPGPISYTSLSFFQRT